MAEDNYLLWLANETPTKWWHDSADPDELDTALKNGALGATINPVLVAEAVKACPDKWQCILKSLSNLDKERRNEEMARRVISEIADQLLPIYEQSGGEHGYACAQVNPALAGDRQAMEAMAKRFSGWSSNIAVKLPVTVAGLDVLEACVAEGITITATVSFTVPQVIAIAEAYKRGFARAKESGKEAGRCFAVIMIGRIDDYLRDVALDSNANVSESDIQQVGIAVTKRAYSIFKERDYEATLMVAALRGTYHMTELAGAELIMSIHPKYQAMLLDPAIPRDPHRIDMPVSPDVIKRLNTVPEFLCAYEPEGMKPEEFITYGVSQRTLSQFLVGGWSLICGH